ncbi:hypothetical protein STAS_12331 [Striga asiatica]|uniref:Uncharacterized protein n=1 Tax=Striga asiatica TaxID=4170 RepID=A0A5A7PTN4_STRAF|nr:hypothetical protein STAS_12331 [Striga asiatica]
MENISNDGARNLRCRSASFSYSTVECKIGEIIDFPVAGSGNGGGELPGFKKGESFNSVISKSWCFRDPELMRKKRIASYRVYTVEGKVKGSIKKSFRWIKERYAKIMHGE